MLVLTRRVEERILIGDDIVVTVVSIRGDQIRLGISAPASVRVDREEVRRAIEREIRRRSEGGPVGEVAGS